MTGRVLPAKEKMASRTVTGERSCRLKNLGRMGTLRRSVTLFLGNLPLDVSEPLLDIANVLRNDSEPAFDSPDVLRHSCLVGYDAVKKRDDLGFFGNGLVGCHGPVNSSTTGLHDDQGNHNGGECSDHSSPSRDPSGPGCIGQPQSVR